MIYETILYTNKLTKTKLKFTQYFSTDNRWFVIVQSFVCINIILQYDVQIC